MFESKYGKVLTVILVIVIVALVGLIGFGIYSFVTNDLIKKDTSNFVDNFQGEIANTDDQNQEQNNTNQEGNISEGLDPTNTANQGTTTKTYKGFVVMGTMEIPVTGFKYPVLEKVTKKSIETAVAILYGAGLNQPGNTVIIGHNYRNGLFFSNNKKINVGDKIYITDNSGKNLEYTVYNKFETSADDTSFYQRDTNGKPEVTLSTCTDDSSARLIIEAVAE